MNTVKNFPRAFVREYVRNGYNGTRAYLALRPDVGEHSARVSATRTLARDSTRKAMEAIVANIATPEQIKARLTYFLEDSDAKVRPSAVRSAELLGKAQGWLVDRTDNVNTNKDLGPDLATVSTEALTQALVQRLKLSNAGPIAELGPAQAKPD